MCASGNSILGEPISEEILQEVADRYDTGFYTAMIWPYHAWDEYDMMERERWLHNLGRVAELKTEREDGVLKLYARYVPSQALQNLHEMGQKLFSSAEIWLNFQNNGYPYLQGVTATDIPASTHTEMMRFAATNKNKDRVRGEFSQFSLGELKDNTQHKPSVFDWLFTSTRKKEKPPAIKLSATEEEPENVDELKALIEQLVARIAALEEAAKGESTTTVDEATTEVEEAAEEIVILAEEVAELAEEVVENPEDEVVTAEFSAARAQLAEKIQALTAGDPHFAARKRRALRAFSAARETARSTAGNDDGNLKSLRAELSEVRKMLSTATRTSVTRRPTGAPAATDKKPVL